MEVLFLIGLILLNGAFAMAEIALITARKGRLTHLAEDGDAAAATALKLGEEPNRFLSTVQIGITAIGILNGIVGQAALAGPLAAWLQTIGLEQGLSEPVATFLIVVVITYATIVVGELVPKRIAQLDPEGIARLVARPMTLLSIAARPFVHLLAGSTAGLLRLMGQRELAGPRVTEEEIHAMLEEGSYAGVLEQREHAIVRNVLRLDDRQVGSLMVPRSEVVWLDVNRPMEANLALITDTAYARFPVCRGGLDDILGIVGAKQLFNQLLRHEPLDITRELQAPLYVPESLTGLHLLEQFQTSGMHMVFVIDEYGEVQGMATLHDLLESVTGEFEPVSSEEARAVRREDGSWLLDGLIPMIELQDLLGLKSVPDEDRGRYHTLSGMIMWLLGRLPNTGDVATWQGWRFEVVDMDAKRIDKVLASPASEAGAAEAAGRKA
ncbi:MAG: hemolysin family protein [Candidatus Sericytochromatia bacterium]